MVRRSPTRSCTSYASSLKSGRFVPERFCDVSYSQHIIVIFAMLGQNLINSKIKESLEK